MKNYISPTAVFLNNIVKDNLGGICENTGMKDYSC